jgi:hypothetical protein
VVVLLSWVVLHVPIKPYDLVSNHKHTHIYITKVIMISIHHIIKDSFSPFQVIATKNFYPKHLFKSDCSKRSCVKI